MQCTHGLCVPGIFLLDAVGVVAWSATASMRGPVEYRAEQGTVPWLASATPAAAAAESCEMLAVPVAFFLHAYS